MVFYHRNISRQNYIYGELHNFIILAFEVFWVATSSFLHWQTANSAVVFVLNVKVNVIRRVGADGGHWPFGRGFEGRGPRWHRHRPASWIDLGVTFRARDCCHWKQAHEFQHQKPDTQLHSCVHWMIFFHSFYFVLEWKPKLTIFQVTKGGGTVIWKSSRQQSKMIYYNLPMLCYLKSNEYSTRLNNSRGIRNTLYLCFPSHLPLGQALQVHQTQSKCVKSKHFTGSITELKRDPSIDVRQGSTQSNALKSKEATNVRVRMISVHFLW